MTGTEQCGYVIRYGSFQGNISADGGGNSHSQSFCWLLVKERISHAKTRSSKSCKLS